MAACASVRAGIQSRHILVLNIVTGIAPGNASKLMLKRKGQDLELAVTVGRRPKPQARAE